MFKDFKLVDLDLEMILVVLFLGVGLIYSLGLGNENTASVIVGGLTGYLTRTIKENKRGNSVE